MKKVTRKFKQTLSILLVAAMVITMVPQNTLSVSAKTAVSDDSGSGDENTDTIISSQALTEETGTQTGTEIGSPEEGDEPTEEIGDPDDSTGEEETVDEDEDTVEDETENNEEADLSPASEDEEEVETLDSETINVAWAEGYTAAGSIDNGEGSSDLSGAYTFTVTMNDGWNTAPTASAKNSQGTAKTVSAGELVQSTSNKYEYSIAADQLEDGETLTVTLQPTSVPVTVEIVDEDEADVSDKVTTDITSTTYAPINTTGSGTDFKFAAALNSTGTTGYEELSLSNGETSSTDIKVYTKDASTTEIASAVVANSGDNAQPFKIAASNLNASSNTNLAKGIKIVITVRKTKYAITFNGLKDTTGAATTGTNAIALTSVNGTDPSETVTTGSECTAKPKYNTTVTFTVTPDAAYAYATPVVTYTDSTVTDQPLGNPVKSGTADAPVYTYTSKKITSATTFQVTLTKRTSGTVTLTLDGAGKDTVDESSVPTLYLTDVKVINGDDDETTSTNTLSSSLGNDRSTTVSSAFNSAIYGDQKVTFKVNQTNAKYGVKVVKSYKQLDSSGTSTSKEIKETLTGTNGVYEITGVDRNTTITITSDLDTAKVGSATFTVNDDAYKNAFKATIDGISNDYYDADSEVDGYHKGNQFVTTATAAQTITITPNPKADYKITGISVNGSDKELDTANTSVTPSEDTVKYDADAESWTFVVPVVEDDNTTPITNTIAVTITADELETEKKVKIANSNTDLTFALLDDQGGKITEKNGTYTLAEGTEQFKFSITSSDTEVAPKLSVLNFDGTTPYSGTSFADKFDVEDAGNGVYNYTLRAKLIDENATIKIDKQAAATRSLDVVYTTADVDSVKIYKNGSSKALVVDEDYTVTEASPKSTITLTQTKEDQIIKKGDTYQIVVTPKTTTSATNQVTKAYQTIDDEDAKTLTIDNPLQATFNVTVGDEKSRTIEVVTANTASKVVVTRTKPNDGIINSADGTYDVEVGQEYTMELWGVKSGDSTSSKLDVTDADVTLKYNGDEIVGNTQDANDKKTFGTIVSSVASNVVTVKIPAAAATAGTIELELKSGTLTKSVILNVAPIVSGVTVDGITGGTLTQNIGSVKYYKVEMSPSEAANTLALNTSETAKAGIDASLVYSRDDNGVTKYDAAAYTPEDPNMYLRVYVKPAAKAASPAATLTFYENTDSKKTALTGGTITINTTQLLENSTPTASVIGSTDIGFTLQLGSTVDAEAISDIEGDLYYMIEVTPSSANTSSALVKSAKTYFVKRKLTDYDNGITEIYDADGNLIGESTDLSRDNGRKLDTTSQKYYVSVKASDKITLGNGAAGSFTVKVSLIQTKTDSAPSSASAANYAVSTELTANTKDPYYTTSLSVKTVNGGKAYTGQKTQVAQAIFDTPASFTNIGFSVIDGPKVNGYIQLDEGDFSYDSTTGAIYLTAGKYSYMSDDAALGKYTIQATATDGYSITSSTTTNYMHVETATFTVQVLRGVENVQLIVPETVLKTSNKAVSFKAELVYNNGETKPKSKSVTWSVTDYEGKATPYVKITKSGKVTIDKSYTPGTVNTGTDTEKADRLKNTFYLYAAVAGRDVVKKSFEVSTTTYDFGNVVIVKETTQDGVDGYSVVDATGIVSADQLNDAYAVVLKNGVSAKSFITKAEAKNFFAYNGERNEDNTADVVFTSSKKKAVVIDKKSGKITVKKTAKKVKITATAADGSKNKSDYTIGQVGYVSATTFGLKVSTTGFANDEADVLNNGAASGSFYSGASTGLYVALQAPDANGKYQDVTAITDAKVSVKGGKIDKKATKTYQTQNKNTNYYYVIAKGSPVTITVKSKSLKNSFVFTITNGSLTGTAKAPKVTQSTTFYGRSGDYEYYSVLDEDGNNVEQSATFTLPAGYAGKSVLITVDGTAAAKDTTQYGYAELKWYKEVGSSISRVQEISKDNTFKLTDYDTATAIKPGTYKLNFLIGSFNKTTGVFTAETKASTFNFTVTNYKLAAAKLNTSYTMSLAEGASVPLKLTSSDLVFGDYWDAAYVGTADEQDNDVYLKNANINGTPNKFRDLFEIAPVTNSKGEITGYNLQIKSALLSDSKKLAALTDDANNLTGYVHFRAYDAKTKSMYAGGGETKITVKLTTDAGTGNYTLSNGAMLKDSKTATLTAYVNGAKAAISYVSVADGNFTAAVNNTDTSKLNLTVKSGVTTLGDTENVTLYLIPTRSIYVNDVKAKSGTARDALIQQYGVKVTATITTAEKANATGKYQVTAADAKQTFAAKDYAFDKTAKKGYYTIQIPYTAVYDGVTPAKATFADSYDSQLFTAKPTKDKDGNTVLEIKLEKAALNTLAADAKSGVSYGKAKTVKVTLTANGTIAEELPLTLTMPAQTRTYADFVEEAKTVVQSFTTDTVKSTAAANKTAIEKALDQKLDETDVDLDWSATDVTAAQGETPAKANISIVVSDLTGTATRTFTKTVSIPKTADTADDLETQIDAFVAKANTAETFDNDSTANDVLEAVKEAVKDYAGNYSISVVNSSVSKTAATESTSGSIKLQFQIKDWTANTATVTDEKTFTIAALGTVKTLATKIENDLKTAAHTHAYPDDTTKAIYALQDSLAVLGADDQSTAQSLVTEYVENKIKNPNITVSWKEDSNGDTTFSLDPATTTSGKVTGTIVLTDATKNKTSNQTKEIVLAVDGSYIDIPAKTTLAQAATSGGDTGLINKAIKSLDGKITNDIEGNWSVIEAAYTGVVLNNDITVTAGNTGDSSVEDIKVTKATYSNDGSAVVTATVSKDSDTPVVITVTLKIPRLEQTTLEETSEAVKEALDALANGVGSSGGTVSKSQALSAARTVVRKGIDAGSDVAWAKDSDNKDLFSATASTKTESGSLTCTIIVTIPDGRTVEVNYTGTILSGDEYAEANQANS